MRGSKNFMFINQINKVNLVAVLFCFQTSLLAHCEVFSCAFKENRGRNHAVPFLQCSDHYKPDNVVPVTHSGKSICV